MVDKKQTINLKQLNEIPLPACDKDGKLIQPLPPTYYMRTVPVAIQFGERSVKIFSHDVTEEMFDMWDADADFLRKIAGCECELCR